MAVALNKNNFIRLYEAGTSSAIPVIPMMYPEMTSPAVILVPEEYYSFYINSSVSMSSASLVGASHTYFLPITETAVVYSSGTHKIISFDCPSIPAGLYRMNLGSYVTNYVEIIATASEANELSAFFRFSHNKIIFDYYYPYAGASYKQRMRLRVSEKDRQSETNRTGYRSTSSGSMRNLQGNTINYVVLEMPDYNAEDHLAANALSLHDTILINDVSYIAKNDSPYKKITTLDTPLCHGEMTLYDNSSNFQFRC